MGNKRGFAQGATVGRWIIIATIVATLGVSTTSAKTPLEKKQATQVAVLKKQLKHLNNATAPVAKVIFLVFKLSLLDPKRSATYYSVALTKLPPENSTVFSEVLAQIVRSTVKDSGLSAREIAATLKSITRVENKFVPPVPTPTPYSS